LNEEQALVERLARGEVSAFQELVEQNKKKIYFLALDIVGNQHDAEDISQLPNEEGLDSSCPLFLIFFLL
jgi:hypothetical protein